MTSELLQVFFYNTYSHRSDFVVQSYKKVYYIEIKPT